MMMTDSNLDLKLIIVYFKICNVILTLVNELSQLLRNCLHTLAMNTANLDSCLLSVSAKLKFGNYFSAVCTFSFSLCLS